MAGKLFVAVVPAVLVVLVVVGAAWVSGSQAAPAAEIQRTFVSTSGSDASPCTRAEPCRGFQAALANTLAGGEVIALDSGGYGAFTVDKAVSVIGAPGVHAAISVFTGDGITVDTGDPDTVVLRNLYLTGLGGVNGIRFVAPGDLHIESVTVTGFTNRGIRATSEGFSSTLVIQNSVFRHNNGGVIVNGTNGDLRVQIEATRADRNESNGFWFLGPVHGSVHGSTAAGNTGSGFFFQPEAEITVSDSRAEGNVNGVSIQTPGTGVILMLDGLVVSNNTGDGVFAAFGSLVRISGSTVTGNDVGLINIGATLESFGDNVVRGNTTETSGTITAVAKT